ncbi:MAG: hypothetical protein EAX81_08050 [Candidatus Thorarchaeota archaeon]|nr:hypothetical protein [Candidatus Thorarchaeota archaeon]
MMKIAIRDETILRFTSHEGLSDTGMVERYSLEIHEKMKDIRWYRYNVREAAAAIREVAMRAKIQGWNYDCCATDPLTSFHDW